MRIIVLDSSPSSREQLKELTARVCPEGVVEAFEDSAQALEQLIECAQEKAPDILIMSLGIAPLAADEFLRKLRRHEALRAVPVMILGVAEDQAFLWKTLEAGATDFLQTPFEQNEFTMRLARLLKVREQHQALADHSDQRLQAILDAIPAMVSVVAADDTLSFINKNKAESLGLDPHEAHGKTEDELYRQAGYSRGFQQGFNAALNRPFEEEITDIEGNARTFLTHRVPLPGVGSGGEETVAVSIDIGRLKSAEGRAATQRQFFRSVIDHDPNLICVHDENEKVILINKAFAEKCNMTVESCIGSKVSQLPIKLGKMVRRGKEVEDADAGVVDEGAQGSVHGSAQGGVGSYKQMIEFPGQSENWFQVVKTPISSMSGEGHDFLMVMTDITGIVENSQQLARAKEDAEFANMSKTEFLANMSHELRTPLNAIINFSQIMKDQLIGTLENEKYLEYAHDIHDSGQHLLEIISDILDIAKIEAGQVGLKLGACDMPQLVRQVEGLLKHRIREAGLKLETFVEDGVPRVFADAGKLKQILMNLIINAVKFTPADGEIAVLVSSVNADQVEITVKDTGIGMREEDIDQALHRFGQLDSYLKRGSSGEGPGVGLGLPLVKSLVQLHGGKFKIESEVGVGTTARAVIPVSFEMAGDVTDGVSAQFKDKLDDKVASKEDGDRSSGESREENRERDGENETPDGNPEENSSIAL